MKVTFLLPKNFRWECQRCGKCCVDVYDVSEIAKDSRRGYFPSDLQSNLVLMTVFEIKKLAKQLNVHPFDFSWPTLTFLDKEERYIRDILFSFRWMPPMYHCFFFDWNSKACKIHAIKPLHCKIYPSQDRTDLSTKNENAISVDTACPGIGKGSLVDFAKLNNLILEREILRRKSIKYWSKKNIPVPKKLVELLKVKGIIPSADEAIKLLNLQKYV